MLFVVLDLCKFFESLFQDEYLLLIDVLHLLPLCFLVVLYLRDFVLVYSQHSIIFLNLVLELGYLATFLFDYLCVFFVDVPFIFQLIRQVFDVIIFVGDVCNIFRYSFLQSYDLLLLSTDGLVELQLFAFVGLRQGVKLVIFIEKLLDIIFEFFFLEVNDSLFFFDFFELEYELVIGLSEHLKLHLELFVGVE